MANLIPQYSPLADLKTGYATTQALTDDIAARKQETALNSLYQQGFGGDRATQQGVLAQAAQFGPGATAQLGKSFSGEQTQREQAVVQAARLLHSLPMERRGQVYAELRPELEKIIGGGLSPEYDEDADHVVNAVIDTYGPAQQSEQFTLSPGSQRFDARGNVVAQVPFAPASGQYVDVPDGRGGSVKMIFDPRSGGFSQPQFPGQGGGQPQAPQGGGSRAERNNNPGNIEDGDFARSLPGYVGGDGRFAIFQTPEAGGAAQARLLQSYGQRGFNTVEKIVGRWSPQSDSTNEPGSTDNYARYVASRLGVPSTQELDLSRPEVAQAVAGAMAEFERGGAGTQVAAAGGGLGYTPPKADAGRAPPPGYEWLPDGSQRYIPGGPADPAGKSQSKGAASEDERKAAGWFGQATRAIENMRAAINADPQADTPGIIEAYSPIDEIGNRSMSATRQQYANAAASLSEAILRAATGAGVNESEARQKVRELTPARGDSQAVKDQKMRGAEGYLQDLQARAGRALREEALRPAALTLPPGFTLE